MIEKRKELTRAEAALEIVNVKKHFIHLLLTYSKAHGNREKVEQFLGRLQTDWMLCLSELIEEDITNAGKRYESSSHSFISGVPSYIAERDQLVGTAHDEVA